MQLPHRTAVIGALHVLAGLTVLLGNTVFVGLLSKVMPVAIASGLLNWAGIVAILAGFVLGYLAPSPADQKIV